MKNLDFIKNYQKTLDVIRTEVFEYCKNNNRKSLVLGISGGIDSALCAAILRPVCDELNITLIGRYIHIKSNKQDEIDRAYLIGKEFCHNFESIDLSSQYDVFSNEIFKNEEIDYPVNKEKDFKIRAGNIKARMIMIYLYHLASLHQGLVISTDNLTEHLLGFWTICGDVGDYAPIQYLWKTEVYELSEYLLQYLPEKKKEALQLCIDCNATDGLGISNTDLDQILPDWKERHDNTKTGYKEVDIILSSYLKDGKFKDSLVIDRMKKSQFKRDGVVMISRDKLK